MRQELHQKSKLARYIMLIHNKKNTTQTMQRLKHRMQLFLGVVMTLVMLVEAQRWLLKGGNRFLERMLTLFVGTRMT